MPEIDQNYTLAHYTERVKNYSNEALLYVIGDCHAALAAYPDNPDTDYIRKLYNELDACRTEWGRRQRRK